MDIKLQLVFDTITGLSKMQLVHLKMIKVVQIESVNYNTSTDHPAK